jgi:hypothetical protein
MQPQVPKYDEVARSEPTPPPPVATPKSIVPTYRVSGTHTLQRETAGISGMIATPL